MGLLAAVSIMGLKEGPAELPEKRLGEGKK